MRSILPLAVVGLALGCGDPRVKDGAPVAGVAEAPLDIPLGTPMAGYTARVVGVGRPDGRTSPFATEFSPSAGVQTTPTAKVIWLHNDDHHLVLVRLDVCYLADHVVEDVEAALSERLDMDLAGQVMIAASHTHQGWGGWDAHATYFLGGDLYQPELDARLVNSIVEASVEAWEGREEVALGVGWARDWDPDDRVYRDRRGVNNDLALFGEPGEATGKDPHLHVMRLDRTDGSPLAMTVTFGIHGIAVGEDSAMLSTEASGQIERALEAQFDEPVMVMHLQGSGGDASPAGQGERFEKLEDVGRKAVDPILALYEGVETSAAPFDLEISNGREPQNLDDIVVTRDDTLDWRYDPGKRPDGEVFDDSGVPLSPFEEFNAEAGAAFCGQDSAPLPLPTVSADVPQYSSCVKAEGMVTFLEGTFGLEDGAIGAPIPSTTTARTAAIRMGPLPVRDVDGSVSDEIVHVGLFPGEPTAMFGEQFRRRAETSWGAERAWMVGYAQDHEGYLLLPEDWLSGGYEPSINVWGPLQAEYLMERVLERGAVELGDGRHQRWEPEGPAPVALDRSLRDTGQPEVTPEAGTRLTEAPEVPLWTPDGMVVDLTDRAELPRVQGLVQLAWQGGDPRVDRPVVELQTEEGGEWVAVTTRSGRPITDAFADILLTWSPDPLRADEAEAGQRTHRWWAAWQAVSHFEDPAGLPLGRYRLVARGQHFTGSEDVWPWTTTPYEVVGEPFEVVPASLAVEAVEGGVAVWLPGPADGFRQVAIGGAASGENPVTEPLVVEVDGVEVDASVVRVDGVRTVLDVPEGAEVRVEDAYGNVGVWTAPPR